MQIKTLIVAVLAAGVQAQSLDLPLISPIVDDLLKSLGDVGNAIKTATSLTSGSGNNPLGLSPNLFGIINRISTVSGLVNELNKIIPLVGDENGSIIGDDITTGSDSGLNPTEEDAICSAVQKVYQQQAVLKTSTDTIQTKGLVGSALLSGLKTLVSSLVDSLVGSRGALGETAALVPGCSLSLTPGTGGLAGGAGAGV